MSTINKRIVHDRASKKNYLVKQTKSEVSSTDDLVQKIRHHLKAAADLISRNSDFHGMKPVGFMAAFCLENERGDKFDYGCATLVDLENVNVKASDMMFADLKTKIMNHYGHEEPAVRQDAAVINQE